LVSLDLSRWSVVFPADEPPDPERYETVHNGSIPALG
jgi:hypothetical protein